MKLTAPLLRVLAVFVDDVSAPRYGYDLMKAARLPSGTLYPMLSRLQDQGLISSAWESQPEDGSGRPPRRYYRLTSEGVQVARLELARASEAASLTTGPRATGGTVRPAPGSAQ